ncbi:MAG: hypothetical protein R3C68_12775 [Myxococcota bacterium]
MKTDKALPVGTEFLFKLVLPKRDAPFVLRGEVIWFNQPSDRQRPNNPEMGMGIRFIFDSLDEGSRFESEVAQLMTDSLGPDLYRKLIKERQGSLDDS